MQNFKMPQFMVSRILFVAVAFLVLGEQFVCPVAGVMIKIRDKSTNSSKISFSSQSVPSVTIKAIDFQKRMKASSSCRSNSCRLESTRKTNSKRKKGVSKDDDSPGIEQTFLDDSEFVYDEVTDNQFIDYIQTTASSNRQQKALDDFDTALQNRSNENDDEWKVRPRLIAVKVPASPPRMDLKNDSNPISSVYAKYPTIRLADFARKIIFPEWIWTKFNQPPIVKKSEVAAETFNSDKDEPSARPAHLLNYNDTFIPTTTTRRPKGILERPTITFDNNMSRFLRLFTVVRFQNVPCIGPNGENGTCYHGKECADLGGLGTSPCAQGLGVCCLFFKSCGETVHRNGTYFVSTGASFTRGVSTCNVNIQKLSPSIRQIRLELHTFIMLPPNAGSCESDRFLVSGQNTNNIIPILCGNNSGSHLYIETGTSQSLIQLSVMTTGEGLRAWSIQVNQIEEAYSQFSAPSHCLQYFEGTMGTITSFNYESSLSPQYLNNLNYNICIRKEAGFCSVTYSNLVPDGQYYPFQIVNADAQGNLLLPSGQAGVGLRNCPDDYILLNGIRLCGERLNDGSKSTVPMDDAPVTDITNGPFTVAVRTNDIDVGGGFSIYYRQNPCMSTSG